MELRRFYLTIFLILSNRFMGTTWGSTFDYIELRFNCCISGVFFLFFSDGF